MTLYVDAKEAAAHPGYVHDLGVLIPESNGVEIRHQDFADYSLIGTYLSHLQRPVEVGIELSTISDVLGKIMSGRLVHQMAGMIETYDVRVLMIVGHPVVKDDYINIYGAPRTVKWDHWSSIMQTLQAHGVFIQHASSTTDIVDRIIAVYRYWRKDESDHNFLRKQLLTYKLNGMSEPPDPLDDPALIPLAPALERRIQTIMTVEGIGEDRARAAYEMYKPLKQLILLPPQMLTAIPGWGKTTARRFRDHWDEVR